MASLEAGFSHDIFVEWASDTKNLVLFTERGQVFLIVDLQSSLSILTMSHFCNLFPDDIILFNGYFGFANALKL